MKVLNCPHCGYPPLMQTFREGMKKTYAISCPIYVCNMPYYALGLKRAEAIRSWNRAVKDEQERIKK